MLINVNTDKSRVENGTCIVVLDAPTLLEFDHPMTSRLALQAAGEMGFGTAALEGEPATYAVDETTDDELDYNKPNPKVSKWRKVYRFRPGFFRTM